MWPQPPCLVVAQDEEWKMQLARAQRMLKNYEIKNGCIPEKRYKRKNCRDSDKKITAVQDCQHKEPVEEQITEKVALLQGVLLEIKDKVKEQDKQAQSLCQQQDKYLQYLKQLKAIFQEYLASYNQLATEKERLQQQVFQNNYLLDMMQQENMKDNAYIEQLKKELGEAQFYLETIQEKNRQLQAELNDLQRNAVGENKEVEKVEDLKNMELVNMMENLDEAANTCMTETVAEVERAANNLSLSGNLDGIENKLEFSAFVQEDPCKQREERSIKCGDLRRTDTSLHGARDCRS